MALVMEDPLLDSVPRPIAEPAPLVIGIDASPAATISRHPIVEIAPVTLRLPLALVTRSGISRNVRTKIPFLDNSISLLPGSTSIIEGSFRWVRSEIKIVFPYDPEYSESGTVNRSSVDSGGEGNVSAS